MNCVVPPAIRSPRAILGGYVILPRLIDKVRLHGPSDTGPLVYLNTDGRLDKALDAVTTHGGRVLQPKHQIGEHGYRAIILDSEGNRIALHSQTA